MNLILFTADRQYSSWSMRARVALIEKQIQFQEVMVPLEFHVKITPDGAVVDEPLIRPDPATGCMCERSQLLESDPSGQLKSCFISAIPRLPILLDRSAGIALSDSIAIAEYLEDIAHSSGTSLLPGDFAMRARIRSFAQHVHSDFLRLHEEMGYPGSFREMSFEEAPEAARELASNLVWEVEHLLSARDCRERGYIFGAFSLADVELAPVAQIFHGWGFVSQCTVPVRNYFTLLRARPSVEEHLREAYKIYESRDKFAADSAAWIAHHYRFHPRFRIIHNFRTNVCHKLDNDIAWEMFCLAHKGLADDDIVKEISAQYSAAPDQISADVSAFFQLIAPKNDKDHHSKRFSYTSSPLI